MDLHGIDLNLLVAFDALMAERNVTRAGARIGRSQPAVSAALGRLRALLRDDLFITTPGGLQPTPRALELAEPVGHALAGLSRALDYTRNFDPATSSASFTLALSDHPAERLLPMLMEGLHAVAPGIRLRIVSYTARDDALALLDAGKADLAIVVPPSAPAGGRVLVQPLFEERFVCIVRRGHPIAGRPLDLATFLELSHLLVSPENEQYGRVDAALAERGLRRRLALTLPQMYAAPAVVARSELIATVLEGVVEASRYGPELEMLEPPLDLEPVAFVMIWHRRNEAQQSQSWLRGHLLRLATDRFRQSAR